MQATFPVSTSAALAAVALLAGCAATGPDNRPDSGKSVARLAAATGAALSRCEALVSQFRFADTLLDSAAAVAAGPVTPNGHAVAAHCQVTGNMYSRTGSNGNYAIGFEMRLPQAWNGRFFYQGNGGLDGAVSTAVGATGGGPLTHALLQGFAVISSDAGHTGAHRTRSSASTPGPAGLRLPGGAEAHADGQGADRGGLWARAGPLLLRRLLQRRATHAGGHHPAGQ
jgi:hypothetical protein